MASVVSKDPTYAAGQEDGLPSGSDRDVGHEGVPMHALAAGPQYGLRGREAVRHVTTPGGTGQRGSHRAHASRLRSAAEDFRNG